MKNPVKIIGKAVVNKVNNMEMAEIGKMAAGLLMIAGGVVVLACGNVGMDEVNEAIGNDGAINIDVDPVDAANVVVETVEAVAETAE